MPFQVSPGVDVSERNLTTVVPNVATSVGALAGGFQWGPVLERVTITNENDLVRIFGEPDDTTAEYFLTAANYLSYSNNLILVRNVLASARNSRNRFPRIPRYISELKSPPTKHCRPKR